MDLLRPSLLSGKESNTTHEAFWPTDNIQVYTLPLLAHTRLATALPTDCCQNNVTVSAVEHVLCALREGEFCHFFHIALLYGSLGIKAKVGVRLRVPERTEERLRAVNLAVHQFNSSIFFLERLLRTFFPGRREFRSVVLRIPPGQNDSDWHNSAQPEINNFTWNSPYLL